jgi:hypothetical protein
VDGATIVAGERAGWLGRECRADHARKRDSGLASCSINAGHVDQAMDQALFMNTASRHEPDRVCAHPTGDFLFARYAVGAES